jgi:hypothetical protein
MSDNGYMIWFVATAAMIIAVLTIGTLAAAGLIGSDRSSTSRATGSRDTGGERRLETEPDDTDRDVHRYVHRVDAQANSGRQR